MVTNPCVRNVFSLFASDFTDSRMKWSFHTAKLGSSGRIRTYDQSVNPDFVGTLPLSGIPIQATAFELGPLISTI
jgi:hypothetical protein